MSGSAPGWLARLRQPVLAILVLAPVLGEGLSAATTPFEIVAWPPGLVLMISLYGAGALLCREVARRRGLGLRGLCLLAAAYAIFEEALVDRFWFHPRPPHEGGIGRYSEVWHTNVVLAANLTLFHVAVSIVSTIVLVELLFPEHRRRPWVGRRGLIVAAAAFLVLPPLLSGEYTLDPLPQLVAVAALMAALALVGVRLRGRPSLWDSRASLQPARRGIGPLAFLAAAANLLLMGLADTTVPWPVTLVAVLSPVLLAFLVIRSRVSGPVFGRDGLRVVSGILGFYCLFAISVALTGPYDLILGAIAVAALLWWLRGSVRRRRQDPSSGEPDADAGHRR